MEQDAVETPQNKPSQQRERAGPGRPPTKKLDLEDERQKKLNQKQLKIKQLEIEFNIV